MIIPKITGVKDLIPLIVVAMLSAGGAMWARLGDHDANCDRRVAIVEQQCSEEKRVLQEKIDRQDVKIDSANARINRIYQSQTETYRKCLESSAKLKKK